MSCARPPPRTRAGSSASEVLDTIASTVLALSSKPDAVGVAIPGEVNSEGRCWRAAQRPWLRGRAHRRGAGQAAALSDRGRERRHHGRARRAAARPRPGAPQLLDVDPRHGHRRRTRTRPSTLSGCQWLRGRSRAHESGHRRRRAAVCLWPARLRRDLRRHTCLASRVRAARWSGERGVADRRQRAARRSRRSEDVSR